ncbi:hypothetical protein B0H14DRAFT_3868695 [Mycena olivaceomarginata]|nr:hypothetical protein B0H14DRAFT_3868695 [Mycena olivaceomarginata]
MYTENPVIALRHLRVLLLRLPLNSASRSTANPSSRPAPRDPQPAFAPPLVIPPAFAPQFVERADVDAERDVDSDLGRRDGGNATAEGTAKTLDPRKDQDAGPARTAAQAGFGTGTRTVRFPRGVVPARGTRVGVSRGWGGLLPPSAICHRVSAVMSMPCYAPLCTFYFYLHLTHAFPISTPLARVPPEPHTYLPTLFSGSTSPLPMLPSLLPSKHHAQCCTELLISPVISTCLCRTRTAPVTAPAGITIHPSPLIGLWLY